MRTCLVCHKEYQESAESQKYCDRMCHRAAYYKLTRPQYLQRREERARRQAEKYRKAGEAGYGNCVIFRDDGGYNRQYLAKDGTWTVNRAEAARCLDGKEADELAKKHGVVFFGGATEYHPTCDSFWFPDPESFNRWLAKNGSKIDAADAYPTERFLVANFRSAFPDSGLKSLLRAARSQANPESTSCNLASDSD